MEVVVDTSVVVGFLRGHEPEAEVLADLIRDGRALLTAITVFELEAGLAGFQQLEEAVSLLGEVLTVLPLDHESALEAGRQEQQLRLQGTRIGLADALIAGICLRHRKPLLTLNVQHFARIPGLRVFRPERGLWGKGAAR